MKSLAPLLSIIALVFGLVRLHGWWGQRGQCGRLCGVDDGS